MPSDPRTRFLQAAYSTVVSAHDSAWIDDAIRQGLDAYEDEPDDLAPTLQRLIASGAEPTDLSRVVHAMQRQSVLEVLALIDHGLEAPRMTFELDAVNASGSQRVRLEALHEG